MIKHLVISGGSYNGIKTFGILYELAKNNFFNIKDIKSIYCTSIGSIIGSIISLDIDYDIIFKYIHKRPWYKITNIKNLSFKKKGLLDKSFIEEIVIPVLQSKNLSINITLSELFKYNNIDLHIFTTRLSDMTLVNMSHTSHPHIELIDALYMSSAMPYFLEPHYYENEFYIDGGVLCNFPIDHCNEESNTILGIHTNSSENNSLKNNIDSTMIEYFIYLNYSLFRSLRNKTNKRIKNNIEIKTKPIEQNLFYKLLRSADMRFDFLREGQEIAKEFLEKREDDEIEEESEGEEIKREESEGEEIKREESEGEEIKREESEGEESEGEESEGEESEGEESGGDEKRV